MINAIDGPAGAGKCTGTRLLAERLECNYLDTGAMYRAVTFSAMNTGIDLADQAALAEVAQSITLSFDGDLVFVNGEDVSAVIRKPEVTRNVVSIADAPAVRAHLVDLQRKVASQGNFVCEGRDQGSVAFPDAFCKIYLTASESYRAKRRVEQMTAAGQFVDYDQVIREQRRRDEQDLNREVGRLQKSADAIEVNTDDKSIEQVVEELEAIAKSRMAIAE
jgi:cytidylate kinase